MLNIQNLVNFQIDQESLKDILNHLEIKREIDLIVCDNSYIQQLNQEFRDKNSPTDVLSFPVEGEFETLPLGSIVISKDKVEEASNEFGHSPKEEFALLFIHAILHLLGFDHEVDDGLMREKEKEIITKFNLPDSLIIRSE